MVATNYDRPRALALLRMMERVRAFERQAELAATRDQLVLGAIHLSIGQEAVAAGIISALTRDDYLLSTHRGHGHTLAKGADPAAMMKELLGRKGGCCGGKGGSMHIADFGVGMLGANGVVGANITIAAGAAHGIKLRGRPDVVACFFGDGAVNRGPFLEGCNWAGVFELPILFVCEDNRYSASTITSEMTSGPGAGERARAMGLYTVDADGNDADDMADIGMELATRIRETGKPAFIHARTYRQHGHTYFDPATYRPEGEAARMAETDDPITRLRDRLMDDGESAEALDRLRADAEAEMEAALIAARDAPWPDDGTVFDDVQDIGSPAQEAF